MSKQIGGAPGDHKMGESISFTKVERALTPHFRKGINEAESTEDVKKVFDKTVRELLQAACGPGLSLRQKDLVLTGEEEPYYQIGGNLLTQKPFIEVWGSSDLQRILGKFAALATKRYLHLLKNPDKTEAKMHRSGRRKGRPQG